MYTAITNPLPRRRRFRSKSAVVDTAAAADAAPATRMSTAWARRSDRRLWLIVLAASAVCLAKCDAEHCWIPPDANGAVDIPEGTPSINQLAFDHCTSLVSVTIPDSVTSIGGGAFQSCTSLVNVTIPGSVTSIGEYTFYQCGSLASVALPDSVTSIGEYAFQSCSSLVNITIPGLVTSIGE